MEGWKDGCIKGQRDGDTKDREIMIRGCSDGEMEEKKNGSMDGRSKERTKGWEHMRARERRNAGLDRETFFRYNWKEEATGGPGP